MRKAIGRVLKSDEVRLEGQLSLNLPPEPKHDSKNNITTAHAARIVESNTDFTIIEVVCSCGAKMYLRCRYSEIDPSAGDSEIVSQ
jgi:hypothetical protein